MTEYWVEVKRPVKRWHKKYICVGLHETTSREKPMPRWGGDTCMSISEKQYMILKAFQGSVVDALETVQRMYEWLTD